MNLKLLSALAILFSNDPELLPQMKEAVKRIQMEELKSNSFLCQETLIAMRRLKVRELPSYWRLRPKWTRD